MSIAKQKTGAQARYEHRLSNGKVVYLSEPFKPIGHDDVEVIKRYFTEWREKNRDALDGYSVDQFLREKRVDVEKGLL